MRRIHLWSVALFGVSISAAAARADDPPDLRELLTKADSETKACTAVSYEAEWFYEGPGPGVGRAKGKLIAKKGPTLNQPLMVVDGEYTPPNSDKATEFHFAMDAKNVYKIDHKAKTYTVGDLPGGAMLLREAQGLVMREYFHPTPFQDEINGRSTYEGKKTIGDTECHVVYVVYQNESESRWYFGVKDYLPRRVERIVGSGERKGAQVMQLTHLNTKPEINDDLFTPPVPSGYEKKQFTPPSAPGQPALLSVGANAPDFELATPEGTKVGLKSLRGKVVLLDFWATWCGPCKRAMPGIQKLHERYKDKPVAIYGVNCWERGDAKAYMKEKEYTYGLLLKGDDVAEAYNVSGIPTFYIIGPDGKIVHAESGFSEDGEKTLSKIIDAQLAKKEM